VTALRAGKSPEMGEPLLAVRGVAKRFGPRAVLSEVGFDVYSGEVLGLIGPNGAGKTTLFEGLAGLLPLESGEVRGADGWLLPPRQRSAHLFYLPDGITPWPDQPVASVLRGCARLWGAAQGRDSALIEALQLRPFAAAPIRSLSKGERKRLLIAFGLLAPRPLVLLDEPFDGLDLRQTREVTALLRAEVAAGKTLFLSIHQLADAARACDRFVLLSGGRVVGEGTLDELRARAGTASAPGGEALDLEEVFLALT
jgi:ABC-2 type transport system ATP-binding protein